jgi:hypothetical protein
MNEHARKAELALAPNESTFHKDKTKGLVCVVKGLYKQSLLQTD